MGKPSETLSVAVAGLSQSVRQFEPSMTYWSLFVIRQPTPRPWGQGRSSSSGTLPREGGPSTLAGKSLEDCWGLNSLLSIIIVVYKAAHNGP